jgi:Fe(3+) dicitrate transport protein
MEDGVLISPSGLLLPTMQAFEILKAEGNSIRSLYNRWSINMVSTQIPNRFKARVVASIVSILKNYVNIGDEKKKTFGYLLEYNNPNSDGFKN